MELQRTMKPAGAARQQRLASCPRNAPSASQLRMVTVRPPRQNVVACVAAAESESSDGYPRQRREPRQPREPRQQRPASEIKYQLADLQPGQELDGTVKAIQAYGAFVDVGAPTDGLVHISQLSEGFVKRVEDVVQVGESVKVRVLNTNNGKLALTMRSGDGGEGAERGERRERRQPREQRGDYNAASAEPASRARAFEQRVRQVRSKPAMPEGVTEGAVVKGVVARIVSYGAFVDIGGGYNALLNVKEAKINEASNDLAPKARDLFRVGDEVEATVLKIDGDKMDLTQLSAEERQLLAGSSAASAAASVAQQTLGAASSFLGAFQRAGLSRDMFPGAEVSPAERSEPEFGGDQFSAMPAMA